MRRRVALISFAIIAAVIAWLFWNSHGAVLRYRLTLYVEDNGTTKIGSSVLETIWSKNTSFGEELTGRPWQVVYRGEAAAVDLGTRGILFAILRDDPTRRESSLSPATLIVRAFGTDGPGTATSELLNRIRRTREVVDVPLTILPMLVRFRDINDPTSVERVDPNDLAATFGAGVKLVRATVQMTDDPVTIGIEKRLRWLAGGDDGTPLVAPAVRLPSHNPPEHLLTFGDIWRLSE